MDAEHVEEYTLEVAVVVASPVEAAVVASSAGVVGVDWSAAEALEAQAECLCHPVRLHPEAVGLLALRCKAGLNAAKGH